MGLSGASRITLAVAGLLASLQALADPVVVSPLPYSTRTRPYSAYSGTVRGDPRTVGMAGATVGLADTFVAAGDNPAGLAMALPLGDTHGSTNRIYDGHLQDREAPLQASSLGAALSIRNFGISIGLTNIWDEGQFYRLTSTSTPQWVESYVREYRVAGAYRFHDRLSIGGQLRFANLVQGLGPATGADSNPAATDSGMGASLGLLYRIPRQRLLLGASWSSGLTLDARDSIPSSFLLLPGFAQPVQIPSRLSLGLGYVPNRLLRADFTIQRVGATPGAALLSNQSRSIGANATIEPHLGVAYTFADFTRIRGLLFGGTYLQPSRIDSLPTRLHLTFGLEAKWSFLNFGLALDRAASYDNYIASIGVDPFRIMELMDVIPRRRTLPPRGFLPDPWYESDEGLATHLRNAREKSPGPGLDPLEVGRQIPNKLEQRVRDFTPGQVLDQLQELPNAIQQDIDEVRETIRRQENKR